MKEQRVVIETTTPTRRALSKILSEQHKSLTEWFTSKIDEEALTQEIEEYYSINLCEELSNLHPLKDTKALLERFSAQDWAFTDAKTQYFTHGIHPYPAKYIPQLPHVVIKMLSCRGEVVWDPFGGSGTTALEALLLGRQAISSDLNPIASIIGKAKTCSITSSNEELLLELAQELFILGKDPESFNRLYEIHKDEITSLIPIIPNIQKWFHDFVTRELALIKWSIGRLDETGKVLALSTLSKIIIKCSYQDSETRYVSKVRDVVRGSTLLLYVNELKVTMSKAKQVSSLLRYREPVFTTANLTAGQIVQTDSIDLIVTSPPYPNATDYHLYHRFRIFWLGFDPRELGSSEIGSHLRHQRDKTEMDAYLSEMKVCLERMHSALRFGRFAVLILGDSVFGNKVYHTAELLGEVADGVGFEVVGIVARTVHNTKRSFASPARRLKEEKFLLLKKKDKILDIELMQPSYKLWKYEEYLRKKEIQSLLGTDLIDHDKNFKTIKVSNLSIDILRRLTFTHTYGSKEYSEERTWQAVLENGDSKLKVGFRKDPKYVTHGLHDYKGKFYPQLAKSLFNIASLQNDQVLLDPFCGSGTVLLESVLNGHKAWGFDLNPLAIKIATAKTGILQVDLFTTEKLIKSFCGNLNKVQKTHSENRYSEEIQNELYSWFAPSVLTKLVHIAHLIDDVADRKVAEFLEVCLSSIVRNVSQQEPRDLRIRRRKEPLHDAPVYELFVKKVEDQFGRLFKFAKSQKFCPSALGSAKAFSGDCRDFATFSKAGMAANSIDVVVTSPPYATALPYIDTDRLSILLLLGKKNSERLTIEKSLIGARELSVGERRQIDALIADHHFENIRSKAAIRMIKKVYQLNSTADVGFRRKNTAALLYKYYQDISSVFETLDTACKARSNLFFVIGDNKTTAGTEVMTIESGKALVEIGQSLNWTLVEKIPISVSQEKRLHNKNGITENDILWFRK